MYIKYQWDAEYCNRVLERRAAAAAASLQGWKKVVIWKTLSLFDTTLQDLKLMKIIFVSYIYFRAVFKRLSKGIRQLLWFCLSYGLRLPE